MKQVRDIFKDFVSSLDFKQDVVFFSNDPIENETTITIENLYHLREKLVVDIDSTEFTVLSFDNDTSTFKVAGIILDPKEITIQSPYFFSDNIHGQNQTLSLIEQWRDKLPLIYLQEVIREKIYGKENSVEREVEVKLFFLDSCNFEDWTVDDYYVQRVDGLRRLADFFMKQLEEDESFGELDDYDLVTYKRFGEIEDKTGAIQSIFNENLTGVGLRFNLPILKNLSSC